MMELFPWEEAERTSDTATDAGHPTGSVAEPGGEPGEPTDIEPDQQPDGDPRELEDTEADAADDDAPPTRRPDADTADAAGAESRRHVAEDVADGAETEPRARPVEETPTPRHGDPLRPHARERPVARKEYYAIGEVSDLVGLPAHVLRYWESQFTVLNPSKNRSGNRAYQRKEIRLILLVKHLLYEEKYTVEGAKAKLDQLRRGGQLAERTAAALDAEAVRLLREDIAALRALIPESA
jgi:DNA-binding transcriptional MerR regulator